MPRRERSSLDVLAHDLVSNYLNAAIGHSEFRAAATAVASPKYWDSPYRAVEASRATRPDRPQPLVRRRVIAVVGAGVSHAYHDTCLGRDAARYVRDKVRGDPAESHAKRFYEGVEGPLITSNGLDKELFENVMLVCASLDIETTYNALDDLFGKAANPYIPAFGYEFLAHLLKHRFIDAIVNFNFDELLDEAIEGELGREEYHRVLAESECLEVKENDGVFGRPIYIKPHGTIGHRATLRFTRADYANIPKDIEKLLAKLIGTQPTTIWTMGFGMESIDFNKIIKEKIAPGSRLVSLDLKAPKYTCENHNLERLELIKTGSAVGTFTKALMQIWKRVEGLLSDGFKPRSVARHLVLDRLFDGAARNKWDVADILEYRINLEVAFAIAKAKGFISVKDLGIGRAQRLWDQLSGIAAVNQPLIARCQDWGLRPISYSPYALRFEGAAPPRTPHSLSPKNVAERLAEGWNGLPPADRQTRKFVRGKFKEIAEGDEVEISPALAAENATAFRAPTRIMSKLELAALTDHLLAEPRWRVMVAVAETGEWLLAPRVQKLIKTKQVRDRRLGLIITNDGSHGASLGKTYDGFLAKEAIGELAWWSHNHHMTVFLQKSSGGKLAARDAIFFVRRLRASRVAPLWLRGQDAAEAFRIYVAYWHKAKHRGGEEEYVDGDAIEQGYVELEKVLNVTLERDQGAPLRKQPARASRRR